MNNVRIKAIKGFEGYQITDNGTVISLKSVKPRVLKSSLRNGYPSVTLCRDNKPFNKCIHRLVAEHFIENKYNKPEVNHIDGDKKNNNYKNLEWATRYENNLHAILNGLTNKTPLNRKDLSIPVEQYKDGKLINTFLSMNQAQRETGIKVKWISACCNGGSFRNSGGTIKWVKCKSAGGFKWQTVKTEINNL